MMNNKISYAFFVIQDIEFLGFSKPHDQAKIPDSLLTSSGTFKERTNQILLS
jgi:hypothetical protein